MVAKNGQKIGQKYFGEIGKIDVSRLLALWFGVQNLLLITASGLIPDFECIFIEPNSI